MKTLHLSIIVIFTASLVIANNIVFADKVTTTAYGGLVGFREAYFKSDHGSYPIWYKIINGTMISTPLDLPAKALLFMINATSDGQLIVELPRTIIDSKNQSIDQPYFVAVGGITTGLSKINATETSDNYTRTLKINFTKNTSEIEIAGTYFVEKYQSVIKIPFKLLSPLKQFRSGIAEKDITCRQDFDLVIKIHDNSPACVKPTSVQRLVMQGYYLVITDRSISKESGYDRITSLDKNTSIEIYGILGLQALPIQPLEAKIIGPITYATVVINGNPRTAMINQSSSCVFPSSGKIVCKIPIIPQNEIKIPNYTNPVSIKNQTIFAGTNGFISCPTLDFWVSSTILKSTGFSGVYTDNRDIENPDTLNYVLRPGYDGTIILLLTGHHVSTQFQSPPLVIYNRSHIKNDSIFLHHDGKIDLDSHPGVDISYSLESEALQGNQTITVTATISAKQDAPHGDYWIIPAPGTCNGGQLLLLTITN